MSAFPFQRKNNLCRLFYAVCWKHAGLLFLINAVIFPCDLLSQENSKASDQALVVVSTDKAPVGKVHLVYSQNTETEKDSDIIEVNPAGQVVYAVQAPISASSLQLSWKSSGAVKISVTDIGSAESIQLGFTVLWDEQADTGDEMKDRTADVSWYLGRMLDRRKWSLPHPTANNILFICFRPGLDQRVRISNVTLLGQLIKPITPFEPQYSFKSTVTAEGPFAILSWTPSSAASRTWWPRTKLPLGQAVTFCDIPFVASSTVLGKGCGSAGINVNQKAGLLHFAHVAGNGIAEGQSWVATYLIEYADGTTEPIFCNLEWNCGVYDIGWRKSGMGNSTWWGPPSFAWAKAHYLPDGQRGAFWNAVYVASYVNPHPEKIIQRIIAYSAPERPSFALIGVTLTKPEDAVLGLVEPSEAVFRPNERLSVNVMIWRADFSKSLPSGALAAVQGQKRTPLVPVTLREGGSLAFGRSTVLPSDFKVEPGPVRLVYGAAGKDLASSSLLGWMPPASSADKPFHLSMIAGGRESRAEWERIRRLGYDAVKIHMNWIDTEPQPGHFVWDEWSRNFDRIRSERLSISLRNHIFPDSQPWLKDKVSFLSQSKDGTLTKIADPADPNFVEAITRHYAGVAAFASQYPSVISINANYGLNDFSIGNSGVLYAGEKYDLPSFHQSLESNFTLEEVNKRTGKQFTSWKEIVPKAIVDDASGFLMAEFARHRLQQTSRLQRQVSEAIRAGGYKGQQTFNVQFPLTQHRGRLPVEEYLRIGRDLPPASLFHETSDRYCISFEYWLMAKRTFGLPYGDEGCLTPPSEEQNSIAYQWMLRMQCWDALYCQWNSGIPAAQNVAWLKPYFQMINNSEYLPDRFSLALSFDSVLEESRADLMESSPHSMGMNHYGLANTLLAANLHPNRYGLDRFPETFEKLDPVLLDDVNRFITDDFAAQLERYIRQGGTFVVTPDTDKLRDRAFLKRFGIALNELPSGTKIIIGEKQFILPGGAFSIDGKELTRLALWENGSAAAVEKKIGNGKLVVFGRTWNQDSFDINLPDPYVDWIRSTLGELGKFEPNVLCNDPAVNVTPYRAPGGGILLFAFNPTAAPKSVSISVRQQLLNGANVSYDIGRGMALDLRTDGTYGTVTTDLAPLSSTIIRFTQKP
jgi:hypothetical protein